MRLQRVTVWVGSLAFGLVITAVGGLIFSFAWDASSIEQQLEARGVGGTAIVEAKAERPRKGGVKTAQPMIRADYFVSYRFTGDDGETYSSEVNVSPTFYYRAKIGGSTPVRYLPETPRRSEIEFGHAAAKNYAGLLFGGLFVLIGLGATGKALFSSGELKPSRQVSTPSPP